MPSSESASSAAPAAPAAAPASTGFGDNKGIKFEIKTGNTRWQCTLQDRAAYERKKALRTDSTDSSSSSTSDAASK